MFCFRRYLFALAAALLFVAHLSESAPRTRHLWRQTSVANKFFAHNLYRRVSRMTPGGENVIISPYAVSAGLSMVLYGSDGNTADEIVRTLEYQDIDDARSHPGSDPAKHIKVARLYQKMKEQLIDHDHGFTLNAPNRLFVGRHEHINEGFVDGLDKYFGTGTTPVDFAGDSQGATEQINQFVSDATNGTIEEAVAPGSVTMETNLVFVSTLFFKGEWKSPFDPAMTGMRSFTLLDGSEVEVETMSGSLWAHFSSPLHPCDGCLDAVVITLPFLTTSSKYKMAMELILPNKPGEEALRELEDNLDEDTFYVTTQRGYEDSIKVQLPKFTLEYSRDLVHDLRHMGIRDLFDPKRADLSLINGKRNLFFTNAQHKTYLKVDEKGTVASASFTLTSTRSANFFIVDRPFLFILRETYTKQPLFMGRIADPRQ